MWFICLAFPIIFSMSNRWKKLLETNNARGICSMDSTHLPVTGLRSGRWESRFSEQHSLGNLHSSQTSPATSVLAVEFETLQEKSQGRTTLVMSAPHLKQNRFHWIACHWYIGIYRLFTCLHCHRPPSLLSDGSLSAWCLSSWQTERCLHSPATLSQTDHHHHHP